MDGFPKSVSWTDTAAVEVEVEVEQLFKRPFDTRYEQQGKLSTTCSKLQAHKHEAPVSSQ